MNTYKGNCISKFRQREFDRKKDCFKYKIKNIHDNPIPALYLRNSY